MSKTKVIYQYRVHYPNGGVSPVYDDMLAARELAELTNGVIFSRKKTTHYTDWEE